MDWQHQSYIVTENRWWNNVLKLSFRFSSLSTVRLKGSCNCTCAGHCICRGNAVLVVSVIQEKIKYIWSRWMLDNYLLRTWYCPLDDRSSSDYHQDGCRTNFIGRLLLLCFIKHYSILLRAIRRSGCRQPQHVVERHEVAKCRRTHRPSPSCRPATSRSPCPLPELPAAVVSS